jgi:hypothetical protein
MLKPVLVAATALAALAIPALAQAQYYNSPPVRVEVVPPRPAGDDVKPLGYWQPGYWSYSNGQRIWVSAHWVDTSPRNPGIEYRAAPTYREVPAYREQPTGWRYNPGYWTYD